MINYIKEIYYIAKAYKIWKELEIDFRYALGATSPKYKGSYAISCFAIIINRGSNLDYAIKLIESLIHKDHMFDFQNLIFIRNLEAHLQNPIEDLLNMKKLQQL